MLSLLGRERAALQYVLRAGKVQVLLAAGGAIGRKGSPASQAHDEAGDHSAPGQAWPMMKYAHEIPPQAVYEN